MKYTLIKPDKTIGGLTWGQLEPFVRETVENGETYQIIPEGE